VAITVSSITALDKKIVGRWNAIDNFFGAV
jgi:hypothetical protein